MASRRLQYGLWLLGGISVAGPVPLALMNRWVIARGRPHRHDRLADVPRRRVAIILGARVLPEGTPSHALADRLQTGLDLYRAGRVALLLVSGDARAPEGDEVAAMKRWLTTRGVPAGDVLADPRGLRTLATMVRARQHFGVADAVVCTQAFHLDRALFLARWAGIDAVGLVADRRRYARAAQDALREVVARAVAFLDVYVLGTEPRGRDGP